MTAANTDQKVIQQLWNEIRSGDGTVRLVLRDYGTFVGYSAGPPMLAYLLTALVRDTSRDWHSVASLLEDGSLYMVILALCGNMFARVADGSFRANGLLLALFFLCISAASGFGAVVDDPAAQANHKFVWVAIALLAVSIFPLALITSLRSTRTRRNEVANIHLARRDKEVIDLRDESALKVTIQRSSTDDLSELRTQAGQLRDDLSAVEEAIGTALEKRED